MIQRTTTVKNPTGIHARPAGQLVQLCKTKSEKITILCRDRTVDPKSIFSVLSACMKCGTSITVQVEGDQEQAVCDEIIAFVDSLTE